jgi:hypothetical protein
MKTPHLSLNWEMGIAATYLTFAIGTSSFVIFALGKPVDLVSPDYYERSLAEDAHLQAIDNADRLRAAVRIEPVAESRAIRVAIPGAHACDAVGTIRLYRPSQADHDRVVPLATDVAGLQTIEIPPSVSAHGRWIVQVSWKVDGREFYREAPVSIR